MSVFFNGRLLVTPTVESAIYDYGMATAYPGRASNVLCILGTAEGGIPKKAQYFDSPVIARRVLRSGPGLKAIELAFNPSSESGSPGRIAFMRVEEAVQAGMVLKDGSGNDVIELQSANYGAFTNGTKVTIESGSQVGKRVTIQLDQMYYTHDNLSRVPFSVRYSGAETTATVAVDATKVTLAAPANTGTPVELLFANYRNVRELCDAINAQPGFSAVAMMPTTPVQGTLDGLTATSCKSTDVDIHADLQAIIDWFNTGGRELAIATRADGALAVPANIAGTYMTGGSNGPAPVTDDWQDCFDALQAEDVQWVVPLSSNEAIWLMTDAHCQFMSGPGKSERRAFVGDDVVSGSLDDAVSDQKDKAMALNSDRTALCFPPIMLYEDDDTLQTYPAYYLAAMVAGGFAAMNFGNTMTNKTLKIAGLDPLVANPYDSDSLINGGVCVARKTRRGYIVSKAVSTWMSNANYNRVEISTGVALDYVARTVREALEIFVGRKASPITLHEAITTTDSALRELARPEPVGVGVIVGDEQSPAYRGITAEIQGDILRVWFECSPVIPINYVLIGIYAKAYSGTATAVTTNG